MSVVVEVNNLCKQYNTFQGSEKYLSMRDKIFYFLGHRNKKNVVKDVFFAVKDVSFKVNKGDVVGIIGNNGAGKSTLLKMISRVTTPTLGKIKTSGRVSSLLEVGTGFHPELTGRENIFLNGSVFGMTRKEVEEKMQSIINFAGVGDFLDLPIKKYSSGMSMRLAFSVAAHLDSDILLIDEVLAVGDLEFQKKCLRRISELTRDSGKTVMIVSHNLGVVQSLCNKAILLDGGEIVMFEDTRQVLDSYLKINSNKKNISFDNIDSRTGDGKMLLKGISCLNVNNDEADVFVSGEFFKIVFSLDVINVSENDDVSIFFAINSCYGNRVATLCNDYTGDELNNVVKSKEIFCLIPKLSLIQGEYYMGVTIKVNGVTSDNIFNVGGLSIVGGSFYGNRGKDPVDTKMGFLMLDHKWED